MRVSQPVSSRGLRWSGAGSQSRVYPRLSRHQDVGSGRKLSRPARARRVGIQRGRFADTCAAPTGKAPPRGPQVTLVDADVRCTGTRGRRGRATSFHEAHYVSLQPRRPILATSSLRSWSGEVQRRCSFCRVSKARPFFASSSLQVQMIGMPRPSAKPASK